MPSEAIKEGIIIVLTSISTIGGMYFLLKLMVNNANNKQMINDILPVFNKISDSFKENTNDHKKIFSLIEHSNNKIDSVLKRLDETDEVKRFYDDLDKAYSDAFNYINSNLNATKVLLYIQVRIMSLANWMLSVLDKNLTKDDINKRVVSMFELIVEEIESDIDKRFAHVFRTDSIVLLQSFKYDLIQLLADRVNSKRKRLLTILIGFSQKLFSFFVSQFLQYNANIGSENEKGNQS